MVTKSAENDLEEDTREKMDTRQMLIEYISHKISGDKINVGDLAISFISMGVDAKEEDFSDTKITVPESPYHVVAKEQAVGMKYYIHKVESFWSDSQDGFNAELEDIALAVASEHLLYNAGKKDILQVFDTRSLAIEYYNREIADYLQIVPDDTIAEGVATILQFME